MTRRRWRVWHKFFHRLATYFMVVWLALLAPATCLYHGFLIHFHGFSIHLHLDMSDMAMPDIPDMSDMLAVTDPVDDSQPAAMVGEMTGHVHQHSSQHPGATKQQPVTEPLNQPQAPTSAQHQQPHSQTPQFQHRSILNETADINLLIFSVAAQLPTLPPLLRSSVRRFAAPQPASLSLSPPDQPPRLVW